MDDFWLVLLNSWTPWNKTSWLFLNIKTNILDKIWGILIFVSQVWRYFKISNLKISLSFWDFDLNIACGLNIYIGPNSELRHGVSFIDFPPWTFSNAELDRVKKNSKNSLWLISQNVSNIESWDMGHIALER